MDYTDICYVKQHFTYSTCVALRDRPQAPYILVSSTILACWINSTFYSLSSAVAPSQAFEYPTASHTSVHTWTLAVPVRIAYVFMHVRTCVHPYNDDVHTRARMYDARAEKTHTTCKSPSACAESDLAFRSPVVTEFPGPSRGTRITRAGDILLLLLLLLLL